MKNRFQRFINTFLVLILSFHCIVPVPAVIAQDISGEFDEQPHADVVIANINAANSGTDPYGIDGYLTDAAGYSINTAVSDVIPAAAPAADVQGSAAAVPAAESSVSAAAPASDPAVPETSVSAATDVAQPAESDGAAPAEDSVPAGEGQTSAEPVPASGESAETAVSSEGEPTGEDESAAADSGQNGGTDKTETGDMQPDSPADSAETNPSEPVADGTASSDEIPAEAAETDSGLKEAGEGSASDPQNSDPEGSANEEENEDGGEALEEEKPADDAEAEANSEGDAGAGGAEGADAESSTDDADAESDTLGEAEADPENDTDADAETEESGENEKQIREDSSNLEGGWAELVMGYDGDDPGFVPLDFDGVPAAMKCMLDENGVYQVTFLIPDGYEDELVNINLAQLAEEVSYLQGLMESDVFQPGDVRVFNIWIKNASGHVYRYKDSSFQLQTPKMDESQISDDPDRQPVGFDGQVLDENYVGTNWFEVSYMVPPILDELRNMGVAESDLQYGHLSLYDSGRFFNKLKKQYSAATNREAVMSFLMDYYGKIDGTEYTDFVQMLEESPIADKEIRETSMFYQSRYLGSIYVPKSRAEDYNDYYEDSFRWVYGEDDVMSATDDLNTSRYQYTTREVYSVYDYSDGEPVLHDTCVPLNKLSTSYQRWLKSVIPDCPDDLLVEITPNGVATLFESEPDEDGNTYYLTASHHNGETRVLVTQRSEYGGETKYTAWSQHDDEHVSEASVADYMIDRLDEAGEGAWDRANEYFNFLLGQGIGNKDAVAWASFMMATNIDFFYSSNNHQDTAWEWENWITLERVDGDVMISKVDAETGDVIADSQTAFRLWYYDNSSGTNEKYYYTQATDPDTGETKNIGFVHYDPDNSSLNYTIDIRTTNGELNIDKTLLEGTIYYLKETVAPENYELDTTVYIICDSDDQVQEAKTALSRDSDITVEEVENASRIADENGVYRGVDSSSVLKISFANTRIVTPPGPDPTPEPPDPTPEPPDPYTPVIERIIVPDIILHITTIEDYNVPLAGLITMNEGDCFD